jgi:hypothetical protein
VKKVSEIMNNNFATLTSIIKSGQEKNELRADVDAEHLAIVVMGTLRLFVKQWQMSGNAFNLLEKGNELSKSIELLVKK